MIRRFLGKPSDPPALAAGRLVTTADGPGRTEAPPGPAVVQDGPAPPLSDGDLDRLAARVAEHLLRGPMAATLPQIVAEVSERLVRLEIDRIRREARGQG